MALIAATGSLGQEARFVRGYIEKKLSTKNWPSPESHQEALADFKKRPIIGRYAHDELIWWCNQWLTVIQWRQFKNMLNSWRFRQKTQEPPKRIQLTSPAWKIISTLAQIENKTISSFIVDKLGAEYKQVLERAALQNNDFTEDGCLIQNGPSRN